MFNGVQRIEANGVLKAVIIAVLVGGVLYISSQINYLFFHVIAEGFAIFVALLIFVLSRWSYHHSRDNYLLFIGTAYLFVAIIDFYHTFSFYGMGVFAVENPNYATQFWIAGRYLEAISLAIAPFFMQRTVDQGKLLFIYSTITAFLVATIMWWEVFPDCHVDGALTTFKIVSEYIICLLIVWAMWGLSRHRHLVVPLFYKGMMVAMSMTILSELSFTFYTDVYGIMNFVGHILKIFSYAAVFYVLKAVVEFYEQKMAELRYSWQRLQEKEQHLRLITEQASDAIIALNDKGVVTFWNRAAETIFGYTDQEVIGYSFTKLVPTVSRIGR